MFGLAQSGRRAIRRSNASTTSGSNWMPLNLSQLAERLLLGERRHAVRAGGGHRLERVGDVHDPRELGDVVADQSVGVAGAVEPFVVMANDRQLGLELLDRADDLLALDRVRVHDHALFLVSAPCLSRIASGMPILPMSCSRPPHSSASSSASEQPSSSPRSLAISWTRSLWPAVNGSLASTAPDQAAHGLGEHVADLDDLLVAGARGVQRHREGQDPDRPGDDVHRGHQPRQAARAPPGSPRIAEHWSETLTKLTSVSGRNNQGV